MRRTKMNDAGQIDGQIARKTDRQFGRQFDRATTSLTPYGMSFWALILAACGGGGGGGPTTAGAPPEKLQREGYVYDGPVKGAVVYVDSNDDGQLNPGLDEYVGTTDASGAFRGSISARNSGKRYIVDLSRAKDLGDDKIEGTADDQDLSGFDTWLAPEGASVVSALTHLIATGFYQEQEVRSTFPNFDPLRENPYNDGLTPEKEKAFEVVRKALPEITRLVERNSELIRENARRIERNSEDIGALKDDLDELKRKLKAVTDAARQQPEQEEAAPPSEPAPQPPEPAATPVPPVAPVPPPSEPTPPAPAEQEYARFIHKWVKSSQTHLSYAVDEGTSVILNLADVLQQAGIQFDVSQNEIHLSDSSGVTDNVGTSGGHFRGNGRPPGLEIRDSNGKKELIFVLHSERDSNDRGSPVDFDTAGDVSGNNVYYVIAFSPPGQQGS